MALPNPALRSRLTDRNPALTAVAAAVAGTFADDVIAGLSDHPKHIPAKYFYDQAGSELFDAITALPEYYPTRTETAILRDKATDIADLWPDGCVLVEFGAGSSAKVRLLIAATRRIVAYVPVDISAEFLGREAERLRQDFPALRVMPLAADFTQAFHLSADVARLPRAGFFPGSTLGNFEPHEAAAFLRGAGEMLGRGAPLVIGIDLVKDSEILRAAYNDAGGVTAAFNLNLLHRMNAELGADFDIDAFQHYAFYNRDRHRVEMHLVSRVAQKVRVCGRTFEFRRGETIHTENSYKYTVAAFQAVAAGSGWRPAAVWTDPDQYFAVHALVRE